MNWKWKNNKNWKPIIFILPEWKTEEKYFLLLKRKLRKRVRIFVLQEESWKIDENNLQVSYKNIEKFIKKKLENNQLSYKDLRKKFTKVFVILDSDVYENKKWIKEFFERKNIKVIFVDPCFERFLLYHFDSNCQKFLSCNVCIKQLKGYIKGYKKWCEKQIEKILNNFEEWLKNLEKCKDNIDLLDFLHWLVKL